MSLNYDFFLRFLFFAIFLLKISSCSPTFFLATVPSIEHPTIYDTLGSVPTDAIGTIIELQGGVVYSCENLAFSISNLTIRSTSPNNNPARFDCLHQGRALALTISNSLTIDGIEFTGGNATRGGAVFLTFSPSSSSSCSISITNCRFFNNMVAEGGASDGGGAIFIQDNGSNNNNLHLSVSFEGSSFFNNFANAYAGGGAVSTIFTSPITNSAISFSGGSFFQNSARIMTDDWEDGEGEVEVINGGGAFSVIAIQAVTNCSFFVSGMNFDGNSVAPPNGGAGGAFFFSFLLQVNGFNLVMEKVNVSNNQCNGYGGGGGYVGFVSAVANANLIVNQSVFSSNIGSDSQGGGALQLSFINQATFTNVIALSSTFVNNTASDGSGGGLFILFILGSVNCSVTVNNGTFLGNMATGDFGGGGVGVQFGTTAAFSSVQINGGLYAWNFASGAFSGGGGAIGVNCFGDVNFVTVNLRGARFISNAATTGFGGGAVMVGTLASADHFLVLVEGGLFFNNSALFEQGGGLYVGYIISAQNSAVILRGSHVVEDGSSESVSSSSTWSSSSSMVSSLPLIFSSNIATSSVGSSGGGGVFIGINNIATNVSFSFSNVTFVDNQVPGANGGGAVVVGVFGNIYNVDLNINNCFFSGNGGQNILKGGGAISVVMELFSQNTRILIENSYFADNSALPNSIGGGALYIAMPVGFNNSVSLVNNIFIRNTACGVGGAVLLNLPAGRVRSECQVCNFRMGYATTVPMASCGFPQDPSLCNQNSDQDLVQHWYVPFRQNATANIRNCTFLNNGAYCDSGAGGGLGVVNGLVNLQDVTFSNNFALQQAGGLYVGGTTVLNLDASVLFDQNVAKTVTAAMVASQGSVTVSGSLQVNVAIPSSSIATVDQSFSNSLFQAFALSETGQFSIGPKGSLAVQCPQGYKAQNRTIAATPTFPPSWTNPMIAYLSVLSCYQCPQNTYSLLGEASLAFPYGSSLSNMSCSPCPFGGLCSQELNAVLSTENYWGGVYHSGGIPQWGFTRCPLEYCCGNSGGCSPGLSDDGALSSITPAYSSSSSSPAAATAACVYGRNASVPLCGACLTGFSQDIRGNTCSRDEECGDGRWVWPVGIVVAAIWCIALVYRRQKSKQDEDFSTSGARFTISWIAPTLLFFLQNISLLYTASGSKPWVVASVIAAVSNLHFGGWSASTTTTSNSMNNNNNSSMTTTTTTTTLPTSSSSSSSSSWTRPCIIQGLSTEGAIGLQLAIPALVGAMLVVMYLVLRLLPSRLLSCVWTVERKEQILSQFAPAGLKLTTLFYTSIVSVVGTLLHCVSVVGADDGLRVVFRAGGVACYTTWQKGLWAIFGFIVVPFPFLLFAVQLWLRRRSLISTMTFGTTFEANMSESSSYLVRGEKRWKPLIVAIKVIERPYRAELWFWPSMVVLVRRLVIALVYSFEEDPAMQSIYFVFLFILFLGSQIAFQPYVSKGGNLVEVLSLAVLAFTAACSIRTGSFLEVAASISSSSQINSITFRLDIFQTVIFFLPILSTIVVLILEVVNRKFDLASRSKWLSFLFFNYHDQQRRSTTGGVELSQMAARY